MAQSRIGRRRGRRFGDPARRSAAAVLFPLDARALASLRRTVRLRPSAGAQPITGWIQAQFDAARHQVLLQTSDSLYPVLPAVLRRVRALLDLDADPA